MRKGISQVASGLLLTLVPAGIGRGQDRVALSRFEVASIKPIASNDPRIVGRDFAFSDSVVDQLPRGAIPVQGTHVRILNQSLLNVIAIAYKLRRSQISGPKWLTDARFDIRANIPPGGRTEDANDMLQDLLEGRFGLKAHRERRSTIGFELLVAKGGAKLKASSEGSAGSPSALGVSNENRARALMQPPPVSSAPGNSYTRQATTAGGIAELLGQILHLPVVDHTGLRGKYDIEFTTPLSSEDTREQILTQLRQFGLQLTASKVPVDMLIIDQISKAPSPD